MSEQETREAKLVAALEMMWDHYENGDSCYDDPGDPGAVFIGNAVRLTAEEQEQVLALIPPMPSNPLPSGRAAPWRGTVAPDWLKSRVEYLRATASAWLKPGLFGTSEYAARIDNAVRSVIDGIEAIAAPPAQAPSEALTTTGLLSALEADTLTGTQRAALAAMIRGREARPAAMAEVSKDSQPDADHG